MMHVIFAIAIALFAHSNVVEQSNEITTNQRDFYYIELHDNTRYDSREFNSTYETCYAINDTQYQLDECVQFAIDSYSRSNA
jgi:two-component SAPR family response regulator